MSRSPFRFAALVAAGALALMTVAPVSAQTALGTADAPRVVPISIGAGEIEPAVVQVVMGETITFAVTNVSDTEVELIVGLKTDVDADSGDSLKEAEHIAPAGTGEVTYTFDSAGPWGFGDQVGDHYAAGAKGDVAFVDALTPAASPAASPAA